VSGGLEGGRRWREKDDREAVRAAMHVPVGGYVLDIAVSQDGRWDVNGTWLGDGMAYEDPRKSDGDQRPHRTFMTRRSSMHDMYAGCSLQRCDDAESSYSETWFFGATVAGGHITRRVCQVVVEWTWG
jgi:hypothetical protein